MPTFVETELGPQIVTPDTPYVAAAGRSRLYFIDTRFDAATAQHVKEQIELATVGEKDSCIYIDDITATAESRNKATGETVAFDPVFARIFFARIMNKNNPSLSLPEPERGPVGDWLVTYNAEGVREDDEDMCCYVKHL